MILQYIGSAVFAFIIIGMAAHAFSPRLSMSAAWTKEERAKYDRG